MNGAGSLRAGSASSGLSSQMSIGQMSGVSEHDLSPQQVGDPPTPPPPPPPALSSLQDSTSAFPHAQASMHVQVFMLPDCKHMCSV